MNTIKNTKTIHNYFSLLLIIILSLNLIACNKVNNANTANIDTEVTDTSSNTEANINTSVENSSTEKKNINIAVMTGPTAIGLVKVMEDNANSVAANNYNFLVYGEATEISTGLIKKEIDIACVPCNLASVLYNKTEGDIVVAGINTLGVLYILETGNNINSVSDLAGKTIYTTGQGTTPEYTLRYLLTSNGLDPDKDVDIQFKSEAAEVTAVLVESTDAIAMLPQPYVTVAMSQNDKLRISLSTTKEWESVNQDSTIVTGVVVARKSWINENEEAFKAFLNEYPASASYTNQHIEEASNLIEKYGIFKAAIAKKAIPYCNVTYIGGEEMKPLISGYLSALYEQNPVAVGGALPKDDFYYICK